MAFGQILNLIGQGFNAATKQKPALNYQATPYRSAGPTKPATRTVLSSQIGPVKPTTNIYELSKQMDASLAAKNSGGSAYVAPSTGGQPGASGGDSGDGGGYDYTAALREAFNRSKSALEGLLPTYDADFNNYKTGVNNAIDQGQKTLDTSIADTILRYGQSLRNALQTSKDLRARTQSTFSGLGTLDSSAFGDELLKQEQADKEAFGALDVQKNKDITGLTDTFNSYKNDQMSKLGMYQTEIDRAKQGVRQAIANDDINQAQTLQNYISQIETNRQNLVLQLASAQAGGTDVIGNLGKIGQLGADWNSQFGKNLMGRFNNIAGRMVIPTASPTGQGYISSAGLSDDQKRMLGLM